MIYIFI